jgi:undecaprenyl-phosphate 4-deoxy-4-formamido-L-arabinose transferase
MYRSAETLPQLVDRLLPVLNNLGRTYELIFVEDGSPDRSWEVLCQLQTRYPEHIVAIQLMRNYGQHNALMCGFRHARGQIVITMDDDLQHPPEEIPKLLTALKAGDLDLVYGRYVEKHHRFWRNLGSRLLYLFFRLVFQCAVSATAFRAIRRELLDSILTYNLNFTYVDGLLAWNTQRIGQVDVEHHERTAGPSGYTFRKLLGLAFNLFTNFSLLPLQLVSACGLLAAGGGLLLGCYYLFAYWLYDTHVPGYTSTIVAVLVLGGVQLLALGVMGEYLGRLHLNVNRKPQYVERQVQAGGSGAGELGNHA